MPCAHFTYHAYGSWLPDREKGFVHWREGLQPRNEALAAAYRKQLKDPTVAFDCGLQRLLIDAAVAAAGPQRLRVHAVATDASHMHLVVSWRDDRSLDRVSFSVKGNLTRRLNEAFPPQKWFSKGASKHTVRERGHFERLVETYLPNHRGWKWCERRGLYLR